MFERLKFRIPLKKAKPMPTREERQAIIAEIETPAGFADGQYHAEASTAVSLKRIADTLERIEARAEAIAKFAETDGGVDRIAIFAKNLHDAIRALVEG